MMKQATQNLPKISIFSKHQALLLNAAQSLLRNPLRSTSVILCLIAILAPFVTAIAICEGIKFQYANILKEGGDLYVSRDNYGSNAPIELGLSQRFQVIQGVTRVVPRVIGRTYVKGKFMAVLGISSSSIPSSIQLVLGREPKAKGEVILGQRASEYLNLKVGNRFSIDRNPGQILQIVGLFRSTFTIWDADLLIMNFEDAGNLFGIRDEATDFLIYTRPGYGQIVDKIIQIPEEEEAARPPLRVQTRDLIDRYSQRGFNIRAGVFAAFYSIVFALAVPSIGILSGFGQMERRREIGVVKALGWQTPEVLEMVALENVILSLLSIPFILLVATAWIHLFEGAGIVQFFIAGINTMMPFSIPSRIFPVPFLLSIMMAPILTMVGTIYSTWRTAVVPPSEAMKK
jgi:ABC-type lipoprotein release transport system permease subunit